MTRLAPVGPIKLFFALLALIGRIIYYVIKFILWLLRRLFPGK